MRAIGSSPDDEFSLIYVTLLSAIASAETEVWLTNAYFVPDPQLLAALKAAAARGVDVQAGACPGRTDSALVFHAGRSYYDQLLQDGVIIFERRDALLHAKTAVIDGVWSTVGSTNLDWRSFLHNQEVNAVVLGTGVRRPDARGVRRRRRAFRRRSRSSNGASALRPARQGAVRAALAILAVAVRVPRPAQRAGDRRQVTRQTVLPTSSATSRAPLRVDATPTGRPRALPSSSTKPASTSSGRPAGLPSTERHEDHLVAAAWPAVPRAVLPDEHALLELGGQGVVSGLRQAERSRVRAEGIVGRDRRWPPGPAAAA